MKPSRSVVVARTAIRSASTPKRSAIRGASASRTAASRGSSPIRTQSALTSSKPARRTPRVRLREQVERVGALPARIVRREQRADVAEPGGAEHRVDQRVRDHVAVGVAGEPARMVELDAAEDERHALDERVRVDADPDAESLTRAAPGAAGAPRTPSPSRTRRRGRARPPRSRSRPTFAGDVRVRGERDRHAALMQRAQELGSG